MFSIDVMNDAVHCEDDVIIVHSNGTRAWLNECGRLHRINGAAIEAANGTKSWYIDGHFCNGIVAWAKMALQHQNIDATSEMIDAKVAQMMQQDLFN